MKQLEGMISDIHIIYNGWQPETVLSLHDFHTPMNMEDMTDFARMKKSTVYYHIENNGLPCVKVGKNFTFFKDEVISWLESYRKDESFTKINEKIMAMHKRKPGRPRLRV